MDFHSLPRRELQALCKQHKIPANTTNVTMATALDNLLNKKGCTISIDELSTPSKVESRTAAAVPTPTTGRVTRSQVKKHQLEFKENKSSNTAEKDCAQKLLFENSYTEESSCVSTLKEKPSAGECKTIIELYSDTEDDVSVTSVKKTRNGKTKRAPRGRNARKHEKVEDIDAESKSEETDPKEEVITPMELTIESISPKNSLETLDQGSDANGDTVHPAEGVRNTEAVGEDNTDSSLNEECEKYTEEDMSVGLQEQPENSVPTEVVVEEGQGADVQQDVVAIGMAVEEVGAQQVLKEKTIDVEQGDDIVVKDPEEQITDDEQDQDSVVKDPEEQITDDEQDQDSVVKVTEEQRTDEEQDQDCVVKDHMDVPVQQEYSDDLQEDPEERVIDSEQDNDCQLEDKIAVVDVLVEEEQNSDVELGPVVVDVLAEAFENLGVEQVVKKQVAVNVENEQDISNEGEQQMVLDDQPNAEEIQQETNVHHALQTVQHTEAEASRPDDEQEKDSTCENSLVLETESILPALENEHQGKEMEREKAAELEMPISEAALIAVKGMAADYEGRTMSEAVHDTFEIENEEQMETGVASDKCAVESGERQKNAESGVEVEKVRAALSECKFSKKNKPKNVPDFKENIPFGFEKFSLRMLKKIHKVKLEKKKAKLEQKKTMHVENKDQGATMRRGATPLSPNNMKNNCAH